MNMPAPKQELAKEPAKLSQGQLAKFNETLQATLKSLIAVVSREIEMLDAGRQEFLQEFATKKLHLLTQLEALSRLTDSKAMSPENRSEILRLKETLTVNMKKLELRIKAIRELTQTIEDAVREEESDGTYSTGNPLYEY